MDGASKRTTTSGEDSMSSNNGMFLLECLILTQLLRLYQIFNFNIPFSRVELSGWNQLTSSLASCHPSD
ncbi:hypothetical protein P5673_000736 [Acropora cervicornis]|uniref:Uncharacterized protein n=1 Tax=Acropora cervicornis TaxID=6130 RepID=A0AAD9R7G6_ACRCE|nr:hypothetical protein P5673_000736 [Acropora cervicornis]